MLTVDNMIYRSLFIRCCHTHCVLSMNLYVNGNLFLSMDHSIYQTIQKTFMLANYYFGGSVYSCAVSKPNKIIANASAVIAEK